MQINSFTVTDTDNQLGNIIGIDQELSCRYRYVPVCRYEVAGLHRHVACLQRKTQRIDRQAVRRKTLRVEPHVHDPVRPANRVDVSRPGHAFDLGFDGMRNALQLVGAACVIFGPQRNRHRRHVVDSFRLNQRLHDAAAGRLPVLVGIDGVIEAHDRPGAVLADLELDRERRHAGS